MTEADLPVLQIEHVDEEFIARLVATAPEGVRVERHGLAAFSAGGFEVVIAAIFGSQVFKSLGTRVANELAEWIYQALREYVARVGRDKSKHISINYQPVNMIDQDVIRAAVHRVLEKNRQRELGDTPSGQENQK